MGLGEGGPVPYAGEGIGRAEFSIRRWYVSSKVGIVQLDPPADCAMVWYETPKVQGVTMSYG